MKKRTTEIVMIALFLAFISAGAALFLLLPKESFSVTEKRYLASPPEVTGKAILDGETAGQTEEYLSDHVPFRSFLVSLNSYFQLATGRNGSGGVYRGKDGWLIEKPFDRENRLRENTGKIVSFAEKYDLPVILAAVPEKGYIYPDKLPANALRYEDDEAFEQIKALCGESVRFADLSAPLRDAAAEGEQVFYRTDHHWTSAGAYAGYRAISEELDIAPAPQSAFLSESGGAFCGSSWSASLYTRTEPDEMTILRSAKSGGSAEVIIEDGEITKHDNLFFTEELDGFDKYSVFLGGNHALVTVRTGNEGGKLLVIKDSFAHCLVPFLAENYSEIVMADLRYYKKPVSALVEGGDFDAILLLYSLENLAESRDIILK